VVSWADFSAELLRGRIHLGGGRQVDRRDGRGAQLGGRPGPQGGVRLASPQRQPDLCGILQTSTLHKPMRQPTLCGKLLFGTCPAQTYVVNSYLAPQPCTNLSANQTYVANSCTSALHKPMWQPNLCGKLLCGTSTLHKTTWQTNLCCDFLALMMPRTCCGGFLLKGGACFTHCVLLICP
jgi:hypothetical protein